METHQIQIRCGPNGFKTQRQKQSGDAWCVHRLTDHFAGLDDVASEAVVSFAETDPTRPTHCDTTRVPMQPTQKKYPREPVRVSP